MSLSKEGQSGRDLIVGSLGPGESFGEESILPGARASTNAITATAVDLVHIPADRLRALACSDANLTMQLMACVHEKLEDTRSIAAGLALCDVEERLRRLLVRLARRQGDPRRLVVRGPYRYARNPMYLGAGAALAGVALYFGSRAVLAYAVLFLVVAHVFVVAYEEPGLRRRFGPDYEAYCGRVRRWIPRLRADGSGR